MLCIALHSNSLHSTELKEEAENNRIAESMPSDVISISSKETVASGDLHNCPFGQPTMEDTLDLLMRRLDEKRYESSRPEDLSVSDLFWFYFTL